MVSKAAAKKAEAQAFTARVKGVLEKAHSAAAKAGTEYLKIAKRDPQGLVADPAGGAYIVVYKPTYRLRTALKALNETQPPPYRGGWDVSNFDKDIPDGAKHSYMASDLACRAALDVIKTELAGEGKFFRKSYID